MKKNLHILFVIGISLIFSLLFLAAKSYAEEGKAKEVVAEGLGVIRSSDVSRARETAIDDALGLAMDQYLGEKREGPKAEGGVFEKGYAVSEPRIHSKAKEVISSYDILDETKFENVYWVKLKAYFNEAAIKQQDLDMIRVFVETEELERGKDLPISSKLCKLGITEALAESGLKVVEPEASLGKFWSNKAVEDLAEQQVPNADLIILVKAKAQELEKFGGFYSFKTNADIRVVKPYSCEIVAVTRISATGERSLDRDEALEGSFLASGRKIGEYVIDRIIQKADSVVSYRIKITGLKKRSWADKAVEALLKKEGIKKVSSRFISSKLTILDVELDSKVQEKLPYYIEHLKKIKLKVTKESYKWIEAEKK